MGDGGQQHDGPPPQKRPRGAERLKNPKLPDGGVIDPAQAAAARDRADRSTGAVILVMGIFATVMNMLMLTTNSLATQYAAVSEQYGVGPYERPAGLEPLSLIGVLGHPIIYALFAYLALKRWQAKKRGLWVAILGAVLGSLFSFAIVTAGLLLHPKLMDAVSSGATPTPVSSSAPASPAATSGAGTANATPSPTGGVK